MPRIHINHTEIFYEESGQGSETLVFAHGLLWSSRMFAAQVAHFKDRYRIITYDHRGQGRSTVAAGGYDMDTLTQDVLALLDALKVDRCHFAGLSMGGFVGLRLASRNPERVQSLILMDTSAQAEPKENIPRYRMLNRIVKMLGVWAVKRPVMKIMFGSSFLADTERWTLRKKWEKELISNHRSITRAVEGVIEREAVPPEALSNIQCPTLVLVGEEDVATVPAKSEYLAEHIPNAKLVRIPRAGHTSSVEEPEAVCEAMEAFLL
ncbi:MAG: alpha/beta fold hydrolase [Phaeodactylibacter sp.]|uniref:alpha/beta fold hydrolase n=1 Tax=Phaeodactylibacter sp. TaxID=1940289 RepID=UPI0032EC4E3A